MVVFVLSLLAVPTAQAAGRDKDAKERAAKAACLKGDTSKGVELLTELYVSTGQAIYIFNQGRCFEQNGKYEEAILRFREFQRKKVDAGLAPDAVAERHIADCQALLEKQKPAAAPVIPPAAPTVPVAAPVAPVSPQAIQPETQVMAAETSPEPAAPEPAEGTGSGRGLRIAGIVTAAVGLGAIATGVVLNLKANNLAKDLEAANDSMTTLYSRSTESTRSRYQTWSWVAYGAGAACLAGGAVLYFLGYREADTRVAFVPTIAESHIGASLQGAF